MSEWSLVIVTAVLVAITAYYAVQTHALVLEQQRDRAATFLPLLSWQSPLAACASGKEPDIIRRRLNVVLWNIGNGAARITHKAAQNGEGITYQVAHFDTPSIVPATVQLTLRLFRDQLVEDLRSITRTSLSAVTTRRTSQCAAASIRRATARCRNATPHPSRPLK